MAFHYKDNPAPKTEVLDDGTIVTRTCAWSPPGCHAVGCGIKLFVKDGELVKVEGDPDHQLTQGRLCPRCLALKEAVYHPDRILYPMKRAREDRGKDKWERISWDEATDLIVSETERIREQYGSEAICVYMGTGREAVRYGFTLSSKVLRTPNNCYAQSGWSCMGPRQTAMTMMLGSAYIELDYNGGSLEVWNDPNWKRPDYVFCLGKEPLESNPDGLWGHALIELMKQGSKLIMVDPRLCWLATRADQVLQIIPGTDAALCLAILNVLINEDLIDHEFVDKWCYGYDELVERVQEYTPEYAAKECGISAEEIYTCARKLGYDGGEHHWSLLMGVAVDQNPNGCQVTQCLIAMAAITGNLDVPGGTAVGVQMQFEMTGATDFMSDELKNKCIGWDVYPIVKVLLNTTHPDITLEALETGRPYELKMAWLDSTNLLSPTCSAQPQRWHDALMKMEFTVAKDMFMNPTIMALADVVLPLATWAEHDGIVMTNQGCQMGIAGAINKALQVGECKSDLEMLIHFGNAFYEKAYGEEYPFKTVEEYLVDDLNKMGHSWEELSEKVVASNDIGGYHKHERGLIRPDGEPGFQTTTGRVELWSTGYQALGDDPLPYYFPPKLLSEERPDLAKEYPLTMTTGRRYFASFHSEHRQIPSLRDLTPEPYLEIHPETAAELGIKDGDEVTIENPWGTAHERAHLTPIMRKDVVSAAHGWWYPEEDGEEPHLFGVWKSNVNSLVPHRVLGKMGFGAPYKQLPVKVYKTPVEECVL